MPSMNYLHPQQSLKLLVLSKNIDRNPWIELYESVYYHPDGGRIWLVLKENVPIDREHEPYAVDKAGNIYTTGLSPRLLSTSEKEKLLSSIEAYLQSGELLIADKATLALFQQRLPVLQELPSSIPISEFCCSRIPETINTTGVYHTDLTQDAIWRIASVFGALLSFCVLAWLAVTGIKHRFRLVFFWLGVPVLLTIYIGLIIGIGPMLPGLFNVLPYLLWALSLSLAFYYIVRAPSPLFDFFSWMGLWDWVKKYAWVLLIVLIWLVWAAPGYATEDQSVGDSVRYVRASMYIYQNGYYPLKEAVAIFGTRNHMTSYPMGPAILKSLAVWMVGPNSTNLFFPGQQTTAIWLVNAGLLLILHLAMFLAVLFLIFAIEPNSWWLWILAIFLLWIAVPSAREKTHAAEDFLWPLLVFSIAAALLWLKTRTFLGALFSVVLLFGQLWTKNEGALTAFLLTIPWMLLCIGVILDWWKTARIKVLGLAGATICLAIIQISEIIERNSLGITLADYDPVTLSGLLANIRKLPGILNQTTGMVLGIGPGERYIPYPILFIVFMLVALLIIQIKHFSWQHFIVPVGIMVLLAGMPLSYLFAVKDWPVDVLIRISWNRLIVLPVIAALMYVIVFLVDRADYLQIWFYNEIKLFVKWLSTPKQSP